MKKIVILLSLVSASLMAVDRHDSDGCGLGWQITAKHSLLATTTRGTTNAFVPPSFGMTSGSLNCQKHSIVKADKVQLYYTEANFENLVAEMAQGEGVFLAGYANTFGCSSEEFASLMQNNYGQVSAAANPVQLLKTTKNLVHASALNCQ